MCLQLPNNLIISETSIIVTPRTRTVELWVQIRVRITYLSLFQNLTHGWGECVCACVCVCFCVCFVSFLKSPWQRLQNSYEIQCFLRNLQFSVHCYISIAILLWAVLYNFLHFSLLFKSLIEKLLISPENSSFPTLWNSNMAKKKR